MVIHEYLNKIDFITYGSIALLSSLLLVKSCVVIQEHEAMIAGVKHPWSQAGG